MKKMKILVTTIMLMLAMVTSVQANSGQSNEKFIEDGYTEEGYYYIVYEITSSEISPFITVSKTFATHVHYPGNVTPPSTYYLRIYDKEYQTTMSGTLPLHSYKYVTVGNYTDALYRGKIVGSI